MKKLIYILLILFIIGGVTWLFMGNKVTAYLYAVKKADNNQPYTLYIKSTWSNQEVIDNLVSNGIVEDKEKFSALCDVMNYQGKNVISGKYTIAPKSTHREIITNLRAGVGMEYVKVTFNNIHNLPELAGRIGQQIEADSSALITLFTSNETRNKYGFNPYTFISLFLPDTYEFRWDTDANNFLKRMAKEYKKFWNTDRKTKARQLKLSQSEVTTLASIVQSEQNKHFEEHKTIAGLYINRLKKGMRLESDPTVKYAVGDPTLKRILYVHIETESPYNTYKHTGLPPGPILLPEKQVIDAVLNYEKNNYIFMCSRPGLSGLHNFATNLAQHNRNAKEYHRWLNQNGY